VLDIDRDRQRISLGLKQTQSDPWQQVIDAYSEDDIVEGRVTKVVTFGAFVEILPGVEGLVHISELANHHVENPREVVNQGDTVKAQIIEMDAERRRLSLSLKRLEEGGAETVYSTETDGDQSAEPASDDAEVEAVVEAELETEVEAVVEAEVEAELEAEVEAEVVEAVVEADEPAAEPVEGEDDPA
jgi:small subunit ribosomal protein S1